VGIDFQLWFAKDGCQRELTTKCTKEAVAQTSTHYETEAFIPELTDFAEHAERGNRIE